MSIEDLLKDDGFVKELEAAEKDADVLALFNGKGIAITESELNALRSEYGEKELSEDNLEEVAGGMRLPVYGYGLISPRNPVVIWLIKKLFGKK